MVEVLALLISPAGLGVVLAVLVLGGVGVLGWTRRRPLLEEIPDPALDVVTTPPEVWDETRAWVIGDTSRPLLRLATATADPPGDELEVSGTLRGFLGQIFEQAPKAMLTAATADRGYELILSPELRSGLGTLHKMMASKGTSDGILSAVVDDKGKIVGHGAFVASAVNPATVALAAWQVAALVTSQKFLADIDTRLARLDEGVSAIRSWLDHELFAKIQGSLEHLHDMVATVQTGALGAQDETVFAGTLEDIDRETRQLMRHLESELAPIVSEVSQQEWSTWFGSGLAEVSRDAVDKLGRYGRLCEAWAVAASMRSFAASLRPMVGLDPRHATRLLEALTADVVQFRANHPRDLREVASSKLKKMWGTFTTFSTIKSARAQIQEQLEGYLDPIDALVGDLGTATARTAARVEQAYHAQQEPLRLRVAIDATGAVRNVFQLPRGNEPRSG